MSEDTVDVRDEDAFDVAATARWLRDHAADPTGLDGVPAVRQFGGGASNLTYLLSYPSRDLVLNRPPQGAKARSAHDMLREFTLQSGLRPVFPLVPAMVAFCGDQDVIGSRVLRHGAARGHDPRSRPPGRDGPVAAGRPPAVPELP